MNIANLTAVLSLDSSAFLAGAVAAEGQFRDAMNRIQTATGATDQALAGLEKSFKNVAAGVPNNFRDVSAAMAGFAQRTGATGAALEGLTRQGLLFNRLTGGDMATTVRASERLFAQWGITVGNQSKAFDTLYRAGQLAGGQFSQLDEQLSRFAPTLQAWGFGFTQSAALLGAFEKGGVNTQRAVMGLDQAMRQAAKSGVTDAHTALLQLVGAIQRAPTPIAAMSIAMEAKLGRSAAGLVKAIRDGTFSVDGLSKALDGADGSLERARKNTDTFWKEWDTAKNKITIAIEPIGKAITGLFSDLVKNADPAIKKLTEFSDWFGKRPKEQQQGAVIDVAAIGTVGPALLSLGLLQAFWPRITAGFKIVQGAAEAFFDAIAAGGIRAAAVSVIQFGIIGGAIAAAFLVLNAYVTNFHGLRDDLVSGGRIIAGTFANFGEAIGKFFSGLWADIGGGFFGLMGRLRGTLAQFGVDIGSTYLRAEAAEGQRRADLTAHGAPGQVGPGGYLPSEGTTPAARPTPHRTGGGPPPATDPHAVGGEWWLNQQAAIKKLQDALDAAKESALRAQDAFKFGELSKEVASVDLFGKSFSNLSDAHKKAALQLAGYRKEEDAAKNAMQAAEQAAEARKQAQERLTQAVADSRIEYLKADAKNRFGDLSREGVALELLNTQWQNLSKGQKQAVLTALDWKRRTQGIDAERQATEDLSKSVDELNLKYLSLTAKTPLQRFAASTLGFDYTKGTADQQALARRAFQTTGNIDAATRVDEAKSSAQSAYVDYLKAQAKADFGENSKSYIALDQFKHSWEQLTPAEKAATTEILRYQLAIAALAPTTAKLTDEQKQLISAWEKAGSLAETQFKRHLELTGTTKGLTEVQVALNEALANGDDELALWLASIGDATKANDKLAKDMAQQQKLIQQAASGTAGVVANSLQNIWQHGFKNFFSNVIDGFKQMFQQIALDIIRSEITRKITDALTPKPPKSSGGAGSLVGSLATLALGAFGGGLLSGGKVDSGAYRQGYASGGYVQAGVPITVGEQGSETFIPPTPGMILPHGAAVQGATPHITVNMTVVTPDPPSFRRSLNQNMADAHRAAMLAARRGG